MKIKFMIAGSLIFFMVGVYTAVAQSADAPRMTKEELKAMLDNPNLVVIDVRTQGDFQEGDLKIKGSVREDPDAFDSWANKYPKEKTILLYCS